MKAMMKILVAAVLVLAAQTGFAQSKADRLVGVYHATEEGKESKIRFTREADGSYKGQIFWLKNATNPDGSPKYDLKNKDEKLRKVRADQVVVVWGVRYNEAENEWSGGRVYNPASGKNYNCTISFEEDGKTLRVKGSWGPVSISRYWKKLE